MAGRNNAGVGRSTRRMVSVAGDFSVHNDAYAYTVVTVSVYIELRRTI